MSIIFGTAQAGTGNLLANFKDKYRIFASDFDKSNVDIMKELAKTKESEIKLNLLENHIFTFDFLNDDFSSLPQTLQEILKDEKKREKLIIFINPPYAEAGNAKTQRGTGEHKAQVTKETKTHAKYTPIISTACNELFAQFFIRIYKEIPNCILASFSTPKYINSQNFIKFRQEFKAKFLKGFIVPAHTFDNVESDFPIGFLIWDLSKDDKMKKVSLELCGTEFKGVKNYFACESKDKYITAWLQQYYDKESKELGILMADAPDFQQNNHIALISKVGTAHILYKSITLKNLIPFCIYFAIRQAVTINWLNNKDNFLFPNDKWTQDFEFQSDCLYFTLFDEGQNKINAKEITNHFIPFSENEVEARDSFKSHFMSDFLKGKIQKESKNKSTLFENEFVLTKSKEAEKVREAGLALWRYYHKNATNDKYNANASLYNIKEYFQGRQEKKNGKLGDLNKTSKDETYNGLMITLRLALKELAIKITPKIYEYGFLHK